MSVNLVLLKSGEELIADVKEIKSGNEITKFEIDSFKKKCLMEGLDDIALTMEKLSKINDFEKNLISEKPWIKNNA